MVRFEYLEPETLQEAAEVLARYGAEAKVLAGGTDLLKRLKERTLKPRYVVNIKNIGGMEGLSPGPEGGFSIGALTIMSVLEDSEPLRAGYSALAQAAHCLGSPQVRNLATIGGNLCNAAPSAETAPALLAFEAQAVIAGPEGGRTLPLENFFTGPGATVLRDGEILTHIVLPELPPLTGSAYLKHCPRGAMDIAVAGVAAKVSLSAEGRIEDCRIGLGAVAPTPVRARKAEGMLCGAEASEKLLEEAARQASEEAKPISDVRSLASYRRQVVKVLAARALITALEKARGALTHQEGRS